MLDRVLRGWAWGVLALLSATASAGTPQRIVVDFDGVLPATVTFSRASSRPDALGNVIPADQPRWATSAMSPQAVRLADAPGNTRVLASRELDGVWYTIVAVGGVPRVTTQIPGLDGNVQYVVPHANEQPKFTFDAAYGWIKSAELMRDGTIVLHGHDARGDHRSVSVRTHLSVFDQEGAFEVVRVSDYSSPNTRFRLPTLSPPEFTRLTYLPNLDIEVSCPVDYRGFGLVSKHDPLDGRALGYASSDGGQTYWPVIDTDDPRLGQQLVDRAKHLHHIEPFEWFRGEEWGIGVIGLLGDESVQAGQIMSRYFTGEFRNDPLESPPGPEAPGGNRNPNDDETLDFVQPVQWRFKHVGLHLATDMFPLNNSERPGHPLRFLVGSDASQAGMVEATFIGDEEFDRYLFRPWVTFPDAYGKTNVCRQPYVFQIDRLDHGCLVAPTNEGRSEWDPNSIWVSDPSGEYWTTAFSAHIPGWERVLPIGGARFWVHSVGGNDEVGDQLWSVAPVIARDGLMVGASANVVTSWMPIANSASMLVEDVSKTAERPKEVPETVPVMRVFTESAPAGTLLSDSVWVPAAASAGQLAQLSFWVKPARVAMNSPKLRVGLRLRLTDGTNVLAKGNWLGLDVNDWTRVVETMEVPAQGLDAVRVEIRTVDDDAAVDFPVDYYMTQPQLIVARQPTIQVAQGIGATAEDRVEMDVPALGQSWTAMVWVTEEPALAMSLLGAGGTGVEVLPRNSGGGKSFNGIDCHLESRWWNGTGGTVAAQSGPLDMFFPAQTVVVFVGDAGAQMVNVFVSRGMGALEQIGTMSTGAWMPSKIRFASADWSEVMQGLVHRAVIWPSTALTQAEIEAELKSPVMSGAISATDLNHDGATSAADIVVWLRAAQRTLSASHSRADVNRDGAIDVDDASEIVRAITSITPAKPRVNQRASRPLTSEAY